MALRASFLLFAALIPWGARAEPLALYATDVSGRGVGRFEIDGVSLQQPVRLGLLFGPSHSCGVPLIAADEFSLLLFADDVLVGARGSWRTAPSGRVTLSLDPLSLADEVQDAYRAQCEATDSPEACAAALAGLEPRLVRSRLKIRPREHHGTRQARLRGRFELALVDALSEEVAFRWSVSFREEGGLELYRPFTYGVCLTVINLNYVQ